MKKVVIAILFLTSQTGYAQLFDNPANLQLVKKCVDYIYNIQSDSADMYIAKVERRLPDHPSIPMLRALNILWANIPVVTVDSVFKDFSSQLREVIRLANRLDGGRQEHPEAIFFEMSARGLLAEYYADDGHYMKALSEAGKAYDLIKSGFELSDQVPDFYLTTGVYNYFREKYPEKYPVYKPLLWFFRSGDIELGLNQLELATQKAVLTNVEAYIYLAYIYLRYEYEPKKAQSYLWNLNKKYPNNLYIKTKLLESLTPEDDFKNAPLEIIKELNASDRPYYQMAGMAFYGLYHERITRDTKKAISYYRSGIVAGNDIIGHGTYYRGLAYLGLGRIYAKQGAREKAIYNLNKAIEVSAADDIEKQAREVLDQIE
ncbi:MAG: hypothetical protein RIC35_12090 [Marinoscillum sp.]